MGSIRSFFSLVFISFLFFSNTSLAEDIPEEGHTKASALAADSDSTAEQILDELISDNPDPSASADPNETISPLLPLLNLKYREVHIPITENFAIDLYRTYTSQVYDQYPFTRGVKNSNNYHDQIWQIHPGYIVASDGLHYNPNKTSMNPVLISGDGSRQVFIPVSNESGELSTSKFKTKQNWLGEFTSEGFSVVDTNGTRYIYSSIVEINKRNIHHHVYHYKRYYLSDIDDVNNNHIHYEYLPNGIGVNKITASDGSVVDIEYEGIHIRHHMGAFMPKKINYNGKTLVTYKNGSMRSHKLPHTIYLIEQATYGDGKQYTYHYSYNRPGRLNLKTPIVVLNDIDHPDGSKSHYEYSAENIVQTSYFNENFLREKTYIGIDGKRVITNFEPKSVTEKNGLRILIRRVGYANKTKIYQYILPKDGSVWATGLPYQEKTMAGGKLVESIDYRWDKQLLSQQREESSEAWKIWRGIDNETYMPLLTKKTITRYHADGSDAFVTSFSDFDKFGHPQSVLLQGPNHHQEINRRYKTDFEFNLTNHLSDLSINNKNVLHREFDELGQIIFENKLGAIKYYQYDNLGNKTQVLDGLNRQTQYLNHSHGLPRQIIQADGSVIQQSINSDGTLSSKTDTLGNTTTYQYDAIGQLILAQRPLGSPKTIIRSFDKGISERIRQGDFEQVVQKNDLGQPLSIIKTDIKSGEKIQANYKYDEDFRESFRSYPFNQVENRIYGIYTKYDGLDRVIRICHPLPEENCTTYQYLSNNAKSETDPKGNVTTFTYNGSASPGGDLIEIRQPEGNHSQIIRTPLGSVQAIIHNGLTRSYTYNEKEQLTVEDNPETGKTAYEYDAVGNLIKVQLNDGTTYTKSYDALDRIILDNANGRGPIRTTYNARGDVTGVENDNISWEFGYDANGNRITEAAIYNGTTIKRDFN